MRPSQDPALSANAFRFRAQAILLLLLLSVLSFAVARAQTTTTTGEIVQQEETPQSTPNNVPAKSTVRGRVIYQETNRPLRRARVMLLPSDGHGGPEKSALTNMSGEFRIENVGAGNYFVIVDAPGVITPFSQIDLSEALNEKAMLMSIRKDFEEVSLNGTNSVDVLVRAKRGGVITGRVTYSDGDPAVNVPVIIMRKRDERFSRFILSFSRQGMMGFRTDDRGFYRIAGLPSGEYVVGASESTGRDDEREEFADFSMLASTSLSTSYYQNETSLRRATTIKVEAGQESNDINVTLMERAIYSISGVVVSRATRQPVRSRISIQSKSDSVQSFVFESSQGTPTDTQGRWTIPNVPDGTYIITAEPFQDYEPPMMDDTRPIPVGTSPQAEAPPTVQRPAPPSLTTRQQEVTVSGADLSGITIELIEGGRIQGTVAVEGDKKPAKGALMIYLVPASGRSKPFDKPGLVQESGFFLIDTVPPGEFYLYVMGLGDDFYVKAMTAGSVDLLREPLKLGQGAGIGNIVITVSSDIGTLMGRVLSSDDGKPVRGSSVVAVPADPSRWRVPSSFLYASTGADGTFKVTGPPGQYLVIALTAEDQLKGVSEALIRARSATAKQVTLKANGRETIELIAPAETPR